MKTDMGSCMLQPADNAMNVVSSGDLVFGSGFWTAARDSELARLHSSTPPHAI